LPHIEGYAFSFGSLADVSNGVFAAINLSDGIFSFILLINFPHIEGYVFSFGSLADVQMAFSQPLIYQMVFSPSFY